MPDSGEGRWTVIEAIDLNVSAPVITESLIRRLRSREENNFTDRMISIMRNEFGGHEVKKTQPSETVHGAVVNQAARGNEYGDQRNECRPP